MAEKKIICLKIELDDEKSPQDVANIFQHNVFPEHNIVAVFCGTANSSLTSKKMCKISGRIAHNSARHLRIHESFWDRICDWFAPPNPPLVGTGKMLMCLFIGDTLPDDIRQRLADKVADGKTMTRNCLLPPKHYGYNKEPLYGFEFAVFFMFIEK
jgi:hypothetical protein